MPDDACAFATRFPGHCGGPIEDRLVSPGQTLSLCVRHYLGPLPAATADPEEHRALHHAPGMDGRPRLPSDLTTLAAAIEQHRERLELLAQQVADQERVLTVLLEHLAGLAPPAPPGAAPR